MQQLLHGGNLWEIKKKFPSKKIIDFSANLNPLEIPISLKNFLKKNLDDIFHYPDPNLNELKKAISDYWKIPFCNIAIGNGSIELIYLLPRLISKPKALIILPNFSEYEKAVKINNGECIFHYLSDFKFDVNSLNVNSLIDYLPKINLLFLSNPNNPIGYLIDKNDLIFLIKKAKKYKVTVIIDECFLDFIPEENKITLIKEAIDNKYLIILRTFTKFFALAGLRIGYLVAEKKITEKLNYLMPPWNINCFAQLLAISILKDKKFIQETKNFILKEKEFLYQDLKKIKGIFPFYPNANYIFCFLSNSKINSIKLKNLLIEKDILIRDCSNYKGLNNKYFRIAVKKRSENKKLIKELKNILN